LERARERLMGIAGSVLTFGLLTFCVYICCVVFRASVKRRERRERRARRAGRWAVTGSANIPQELGTNGGSQVPEEGGQ
jgi:threonine/homoserine/homoserine lactone efflux protein